MRLELDTTRCIPCTHPKTTSQRGRKEHQRTGLCEACWDILAADDSCARNTAAGVQCDRLLADANIYTFLSEWSALSRCKDEGSITCTETHVRYIVRVGAGVAALPDIWAPGMQPAP